MVNQGTYYTADGVEITPGLRVFTNDWIWGTVEPTQFTRNGITSYNGEYFDGWFNVILEDTRYGSRIYNGERMSTTKPPAIY